MLQNKKSIKKRNKKKKQQKSDSDESDSSSADESDSSSDYDSFSESDSWSDRKKKVSKTVSFDLFYSIYTLAAGPEKKWQEESD